MSNDFNSRNIEEFRANRGRIAFFGDARMLLLTTTGARTGRPHTVPLGYVPDETLRLLVIGSAGGGDRHPAWYHNVRANPQVTVEDGIFTYPAVAEVLTGEERDRLFARIVEAQPGYGDYQRNTKRVLPVVALRNASQGPPRAGNSFGETLMAIHDSFRRELALVRSEVAAAGPALGAQLRVNCLSVCGGLHIHHRGEDGGIFPAVLARSPELAPVIDRLSTEHKAIAALIEELEAAVRTENPLPQVERLIDELEAHLRYEEEMLVPLL
ncbi:deazaflavin-dependent oxidoreductase (nitroreductase family) [Catenuloplanes nepalensis]|uniref:Deazaflavin-dependent oxidoreductase (Nitroreductase family) n=1 Tax=Catenuloplanes nepalensis TaxID=587533 RepID=A0ABT9MSV9_9ACTN|nr:nitroreductase/quinone reductase family protein [Catenuloplanes nepalensis]MDP9794473.1 deazaflavin-dependent oxidoreductase (nitroreductase family) [Catenuloplanes nepalensis]